VTYSHDLDRRMTLAGAGCGLAAVVAYFGAAFLPLPEGLGRLLAFAFGPLLAVSFLGLYHVLADRCDGPALRFGVVLGILAGATVTVMLSVQMGNNMMRGDQLSGADTEAAREIARIAHQAVNRVQMLIDVAWDVFICGAGGLVGLAMLKHPRFGRIWGGTGIAASVALLYLNLDTYPNGPAYAGSVDLGPLLAVWFMAVYAWILAFTLKGRRSLG
jgi:hypothetical protein